MIRFAAERIDEGRVCGTRFRLGVEVKKLVDGSGMSTRVGRKDYPYLWCLVLSVGFWEIDVKLFPFVSRRDYKRYWK